jgi:hypothetical protein
MAWAAVAAAAAAAGWALDLGLPSAALFGALLVGWSPRSPGCRADARH